MKFSLIRPALALMVAAGLSACGGSNDKAEFIVAGTIQGVVYPGLKLITNGMEIDVPPPATPGEAVKFAFPTPLEYGDVYNVQFKSFPAHQSCGMTYERDESYNDTAGRMYRIDIQFSCYVNSYSIGGKITGLKADGLKLANGSTGGVVTITKPTDGSTAPIEYALPNVTYGVTYGVAVIEQPTGQYCTVANAAGTMGDAVVDNIDVTCVDL